MRAWSFLFASAAPEPRVGAPLALPPRRFGSAMGRRGKITVRNKSALAAVPLWDWGSGKVNSLVRQGFRGRGRVQETPGDWPTGHRRRPGTPRPDRRLPPVAA